MQFTMDSFEKISLSRTHSLSCSLLFYFHQHIILLLFILLLLLFLWDLRWICSAVCKEQKIMFYWNLLSIYHLWMCKRRRNIIKFLIFYYIIFFLGFYYSINFNLKSLNWNFSGFLLCFYVFMYFYCCSWDEKKGFLVVIGDNQLHLL